MDLNLISVIRLSTDEQAKEGRAGLDRQRHDVEIVKRSHTANIVRGIEVIESGSDVRDNAEFQRVFEELAEPGIDGVACSALDRLVRPDGFEDFMVLEYFRVNKKKIYTPNGVIDPSSQGGFVQSTLFAMLAGLEKQNIRQRTQDGKNVNRRKGWWVQALKHLTRGVLYDRETHTWSYDLDPDAPPLFEGHRPGYAQRILRMFHLFVVQNYSYPAIARDIGDGWTPRGIRLTLTNPIWIGYQRYEIELVGPKILSASGRKYREHRKRSNPWSIQVIKEPLIPVEMFERAQEIARERSKQKPGRQAGGASLRRKRFLGSGLCQCACGRALYFAHDRPDRRGFYYCSSGHPNFVRFGDANKPCGLERIGRVEMDRAISEKVVEQLLDANFIRMILERHQQPRPTGSGQNRERALANLQRQEERLIDLEVSGRISREQFDKRRRKIETDRLAIQQQYPKETAPVWDSSMELAGALAKAFARFRRLPYDQQWDVLHRGVQKIMIGGRKILSITLSGGFLGEFAERSKVDTRSQGSTKFAPYPDLTIQFPQPILIDELGRAA